MFCTSYNRGLQQLQMNSADTANIFRRTQQFHRIFWVTTVLALPLLFTLTVEENM
jgi:hypothetical protein